MHIYYYIIIIMSASHQGECIELKNIKYKSLMLKNNQKRGDAAIQMLHNTSATNSISHIDSYLESERALNNTEPWGKLDKTVKISKILTFAKSYIELNSLPESESANLVAFLITCIDHKKIVKTKDVVYDKISGKIISIPVLTHVVASASASASLSSDAAPTTKFTLRRCDKRQSTLKSLSVPKRKICIDGDDVTAQVDE